MQQKGTSNLPKCISLPACWLRLAYYSIVFIANIRRQYSNNHSEQSEESMCFISYNNMKFLCFVQNAINDLFYL